MFQTSPIRHRLASACRPLIALVVAGSLALAAAPAVTALAGGNQQHLDREVIKRMGLGTAIPVILVARDQDLNLLADDLHRNGLKHVVRVPLAHGLSASLTPAWIQWFATDPHVARIAFDAPVRLTDTPFNPRALATVYPSVVDAVAAWSNPLAPLTGQGVGVAVIDSGIAQHPDFGNRVIVSQDFNPNVPDASDGYGHGTAVAGIIGGDGTAGGGQYIGIAPQANLINLRVNDGSGAAPTSAIMNAVLWAVQNKSTYNIRVINLSMQASVAESYHTSPIDAAVEYAWLKGIVVVVAAGNSGPNSELYAPANDPFVITVGATDDAGTVSTTDDTLAAFSSYGTTQDGYAKPELVAPGRHIVTTLAPGSAFAITYPSYMVAGQYIKLSGTSLAAPQVTGIAALYLEANPTTRPGQFKAALLANANALGLAGTGAGYPDGERVIKYTGLVGNANHGIDPNDYLKVMYMQANSLTGLPLVSWDSVSWDNVSWSSVSWNNTLWNLVSWAS